MANPKQILRLPQVIDLTGLSKSTIYRMELRGTFPPRVQLGPNSVGWRLGDVEAFLESREPALNISPENLLRAAWVPSSRREVRHA